MAKQNGFIKPDKRAVIGIFFVFLIAVSIPLSLAFFIVTYYQKIYPHIAIDQIDLGGLTQSEATITLTNKKQIPDSLTIVIQSSTGTKTTTVSSSDLGAHYDYSAQVKKAYEIGRSGNFAYDIDEITRSLRSSMNMDLPLLVNDDLFIQFLDALSEGVGNPPVEPRFLLKNGTISVQNGVSGDQLPSDYAKQSILDALAQEKSQVVLNTKIKNAELTQAELDNATARANALNGKNIVITINDKQSITLKIDKLLPFLNPQGGYKQNAIRSFVSDFATENDHEVSEPVFKFEGTRVQEFAPGAPGVKIDQEEFFQKLSIALSTLEESSEQSITVEAPHGSVSPTTKVSDVNNLGIKELIGEGTSRFSGSIPSRVYNVALASSRINGVLVAPNQTFSFAEAIGDVSKYTGYKEAYIIQGGHTILGDGGGVCQVSTTLFRAVMNAGLPIVERHAHAYRVGYYEQDSGPGLDATVFVPTVDFKFLNDTGNYILIQTSVDTKKLTADFKIYGTSDGRVATVTKPVVTNQIAPEEDLYIDDPTLPAGKINQVEHKAWGARVNFSYTVTRQGEQIYNKNFVSVYQPWRAVFMRGVGPT